MSQTDYINFKKTTRLLNDISDLSSTVDSNQYTLFKSYNAQTTIANDSILYNRLLLPGTHTVFGVDKTKGCFAEFTMCVNTNNRDNRRPLNERQATCFPVMKAPGRTVPRYDKKPPELRCPLTKLKCVCISGRCACETT